MPTLSSIVNSFLKMFKFKPKEREGGPSDAPIIAPESQENSYGMTMEEEQAFMEDPAKLLVISDVGQEVWKRGTVTDIWTGKVGEREICIKAFRPVANMDQKKLKKELQRRVAGWKHVSHFNVLPFLGVSEIVPPFGMVAPRMWGNIVEYIGEHQDADRPQLLAGAACGLEYLHSQDVVHGDINPRNILITFEGVARIGDFGIAEIINGPNFGVRSGSHSRQDGAICYTTPEQLNTGTAAGKPSDVYSFAMTAYEVLVGIRPYHGEKGVASRIVSSIQPLRPQNEAALKWLSDNIWGTLESCWTSNPSARPTIEKVHQAFRDSSRGSSRPRKQNDRKKNGR